MNEKPSIKPKAKFPDIENQLIAEMRENNGDVKTYEAPEGEELVMKIPNLESEILDAREEIQDKVSEKAKTEFSKFNDIDDILDRENEIASQLRKAAAEKISQNPENPGKINLELETHLEKISEQSSERMGEITGYYNPELSGEEDEEKTETEPTKIEEGVAETKEEKEKEEDKEEEKEKEKEEEYKEEEEQTINLENVKWPPENSRELKSLKKLQERNSKKSPEYNLGTKEKVAKNIPESLIGSFGKAFNEKKWEKPTGTFIERVFSDASNEWQGTKKDWEESKVKIAENHKKSIETYQRFGKSFGSGARKSLEMLKSTPEKLANAPIKILRGAAKAGMWMNENKGKVALGAIGATVGGFLLFNFLKFVALPIVLAKEFKKQWK